MSAQVKKIELSVDKDLATSAEHVLDKLGLTPAQTVTLLYKRIAATGGLPFNVELTADEKKQLGIKTAAEKDPQNNIQSQEEFDAWMND